MSRRKRTTRTGPTPVETIKHKDERANIPTNELRGMLADDERDPKKMLYPRDPSLDPQLVWKGKDEQDGGGEVQNRVGGMRVLPLGAERHPVLR